jgi:hypothetical protein
MPRKLVAVHQPNFLPWLGWFAKAAQADLFVLLDDVQFSRGSYTHRVEVKTRSGTTRLSVPVRRPEHGFPRIDAATIADDGRWAIRHGETLRQSYGRSPGWDAVGPAVCAVLASAPASLCELNLRLIELLRDALGITTPFVRASEFGQRTGAGSEDVAELCLRVGATAYLSGSGARSYNRPAHFASRGVDLAYSSFVHPTYAQPHGEFVAGLSALDLVFSAPADGPCLLRSGLRDPTP